MIWGTTRLFPQAISSQNLPHLRTISQGINDSLSSPLLLSFISPLSQYSLLELFSLPFILITSLPHPSSFLKLSLSLLTILSCFLSGTLFSINFSFSSLKSQEWVFSPLSSFLCSHHIASLSPLLRLSSPVYGSWCRNDRGDGGGDV